MRKASYLFGLWLVTAVGLSSVTLGQLPETGVSMSGTIGTVTIDGKQWQRLNFRPEVPIWKFGIALDIELFIDHQGKFNNKGWDFKNRAKATESLLRKIYYVRYGHPGDQTFVKVGALDDVTLGYGLIMDGYCNTLEYPGVKKIGLQFNFGDISSFDVGIEGMVNNFQDFGRKGGLAGARVFAKPATQTDIPFLKNLTAGATYVTDINQFGGLEDSDSDGYPDACDDFPGDDKRWLDTDGNGIEDEYDIDDDGDGILDADYRSPYNQLDSTTVAYLQDVDIILLDWDVRRGKPFKHDSADPFSMIGLDVGFPIVDVAPLRVDLYGQYARVLDDDDEDKAKGSGIAAPGVRVRFRPVVAKLEYRRSRGDFEYEYFNRLYELDRVRISAGDSVQTKDSSLESTKLSGIFGKLKADLGGLAAISAGYQYLTGTDKGDSSVTHQSISAEVSLLRGTLVRIPKVNHASAYYQKKRIDTREYSFFEPTPDTIYGYRIGIGVGTGLTLMWHTQYTHVIEKGEVKSKKFVSIETVIKF